MPPRDYWPRPETEKRERWDATFAHRLGLKQQQMILLLWPPEGFIERLGENYAKAGKYDLEPTSLKYDYIHSFITSRFVFENLLPDLVNRLQPEGIFWVSWPSRQAEHQSELTRRLMQEICTSHGLLESKTLKIDDDWSALKFIHDPNKSMHYTEKREVLRFGL